MTFSGIVWTRGLKLNSPGVRWKQSLGGAGLHQILREKSSGRIIPMVSSIMAWAKNHCPASRSRPASLRPRVWIFAVYSNFLWSSLFSFLCYHLLLTLPSFADLIAVEFVVSELTKKRDRFMSLVSFKIGVFLLRPCLLNWKTSLSSRAKMSGVQRYPQVCYFSVVTFNVDWAIEEWGCTCQGKAELAARWSIRLAAKPGQ